MKKSKIVLIIVLMVLLGNVTYYVVAESETPLLDAFLTWLLFFILYMLGRFLWKAPIGKLLSEVNKTSKQRKRKPTLTEILMERDGITEREANKRIARCKRDLDAAMDDGSMDELEDIVREKLGVDSSYTDWLI